MSFAETLIETLIDERYHIDFTVRLCVQTCVRHVAALDIVRVDSCWFANEGTEAMLDDIELMPVNKDRRFIDVTGYNRLEILQLAIAYAQEYRATIAKCWEEAKPKLGITPPAPAETIEQVKAQRDRALGALEGLVSSAFKEGRIYTPARDKIDAALALFSTSEAQP